jgi:hypothetical protein
VDPALVIIYSKINFNDSFWLENGDGGRPAAQFAYVLLGKAPGRLAVKACWVYLVDDINATCP